MHNVIFGTGKKSTLDSRIEVGQGMNVGTYGLENLDDLPICKKNLTKQDLQTLCSKNLT